MLTKNQCWLYSFSKIQKYNQHWFLVIATMILNLLKLARKKIIVAILDRTSWHFFCVSFVQKWVLEKFLFRGFVNNGD
jgi:hypothetical protein